MPDPIIPDPAPAQPVLPDPAPAADPEPTPQEAPDAPPDLEPEELPDSGDYPRAPRGTGVEGDQGSRPPDYEPHGAPE